MDDDQYLKLFQHMSQEHGLTLLNSEMDAIIYICSEVLEDGTYMNPYENVNFDNQLIISIL